MDAGNEGRDEAVTNSAGGLSPVAFKAPAKRSTQEVLQYLTDFNTWLDLMIETYYLTRSEAAAIRETNESTASHAWAAEWMALFDWWMLAQNQPGRAMSDWHDGLARVIGRMDLWKQRRAAVEARKAHQPAVPPAGAGMR